jgi:hypothetical protein
MFLLYIFNDTSRLSLKILKSYHTCGQRLNAAALQIFKKQYHTIAIITLTDEPIA